MSEQPTNGQPQTPEVPQATPPVQATAPVQPPAWRGWAVLAAALVATFVLGLLAASILERRQEAH